MKPVFEQKQRELLSKTLLRMLWPSSLPRLGSYRLRSFLNMQISGPRYGNLTGWFWIYLFIYFISIIDVWGRKQISIDVATHFLAVLPFLPTKHWHLFPGTREKSVDTQLLGTCSRVLLKQFPLSSSVLSQRSVVCVSKANWDMGYPRHPSQLPKEDGSVTPGSLPPLGSSCLPWALVIPSKMGRRSCCGPGSRLLGEAPLSYTHLQDKICLSGQREGWASHRETQSILCDPHIPTLTPLAHSSAKPVVTLCSAVV